VILWLDAQLPPGLAPWLTQTFGLEAYSASYLGMRDADDPALWNAARAAGVVLVSKVRDFVDLVKRLGTPPQILWVTCGNTTNAYLREVFARAFEQLKTFLEQGVDVVELSD